MKGRGFRCLTGNDLLLRLPTFTVSLYAFQLTKWLKKESFYASFILVEKRLDSLKAEFLADTGRDKGIGRTD